MGTKAASLIFGIAFLAVGILGYFPNPIISTSDAIFHTDSLHNIVHIVSATIFFIFGIAFPASAGSFLKVFGTIYLLIGIAGIIAIGNDEHVKLFGFLLVNGADNYLHIGLGAAILLAGFLPSIEANLKSRTA